MNTEESGFSPASELNPFRLRMLKPFRVAECTVWRVKSAEWNEFAENVSFACAERFNPGRTRGLVINTTKRKSGLHGEDQWGRMRQDYRSEPALFGNRIGSYMSAHPLFPFLYITRTIDPHERDPDFPSDAFLFHVLAVSGMFEWIWIHEPEDEEDDHDGRDDRPVCEQPLSMVF